MTKWLSLQTANSSAVLKGALAKGYTITHFRQVGASTSGHPDEGGIYIAYTEIILRKGDKTIKCFASQYAVPDSKTVLAYQEELEAGLHAHSSTDEPLELKAFIQKNEDDWAAGRIPPMGSGQ